MNVCSKVFWQQNYSSQLALSLSLSLTLFESTFLSPKFSYSGYNTLIITCQSTTKRYGIGGTFLRFERGVFVKTVLKAYF